MFLSEGHRAQSPAGPHEGKASEAWLHVAMLRLQRPSGVQFVQVGGRKCNRVWVNVQESARVYVQ